ncbi:putative bifunctional diguanylate cyclase/phosphodiesterase [Atopomonas sediminilitoris]|uniref:putative bifunctional diguanylate cyclase/phosphodiesterase n=1 Tax=Atopomonas sediminilitoris TaxID=2919919 RepID=UPI001F4ED3A9|nr:bifunctional diguanylate cyclase/phosphodiesterase [Atopomonas sediminilitoris]MCJ8168219.1 bifunctional diguanylate cyclase/phosphodiesterase [Atopomonas sediminilitoris]
MSLSPAVTHLLLLAREPHWAQRLGELLGPRLAARLITAPNWEAASSLLDERPGILLCTPQCRPPAAACNWPLVLLLDNEPLSPPRDASDWLSSDHLTRDAVQRCLRYACERFSLQQRLQRLAGRDALTGVINRQGFQALLNARLAETGGEGWSLVHLDIDHFHQVNERCGHRGGDSLIQQLAQRLQESIGLGDTLSRLGSDEFAILLDVRGEPSRGERMVQLLQDELSAAFEVEGQPQLLSCSLGLAHGLDGIEADLLLSHAHIALQQARSVSGTSYRIFDARHLEAGRSLADLEADLRRALRRDELELHYQPRLALDSGAIIGLEALVRWRHPQRGLLQPQDFIPLAEESGLIIPLGYWVIDRALRDLQLLQGQGHLALHMAVNLSFQQFQDSLLLPTLQRLFRERGLPHDCFEFELTETAMMRRSSHVLSTMQALRELGVRFSLDDFGTGYSSFQHLASLPVSLLKLDKGFVQRMTEQATDRRLVRAMINLAHDLELPVVAEGVENAEQLALLRQFGADQVQGYLISQAQPLSELSPFLRRHALNRVLQAQR